MITLMRKSTNESSPHPTSPDSAPAHANSEGRFEVLHKLAPSTAPKTPPMIATAHFMSGQATAAVRIPPTVAPTNGAPLFSPILYPSAAANSPALSVTSHLKIMY